MARFKAAAGQGEAVVTDIERLRRRYPGLTFVPLGDDRVKVLDPDAIPGEPELIGTTGNLPGKIYSQQWDRMACRFRTAPYFGWPKPAWW